MINGVDGAGAMMTLSNHDLALKPNRPEAQELLLEGSTRAPDRALPTSVRPLATLRCPLSCAALDAAFGASVRDRRPGSGQRSGHSAYGAVHWRKVIIRGPVGIWLRTAFA